jgi:hypothetical protein
MAVRHAFEHVFVISVWLDIVSFYGATNVTPHMVEQDHLTKAGKRRKTRSRVQTTQHPGYAISQRIRRADRGDIRLGFQTPA